MTGPGGDIVAGAGDQGHLRTSRADREQVVNVLKAAFVEERLDRDDFELRVGRALESRTYADLAALTADLPAGLGEAQPLRQPAGTQPRPPISNAAKVSACVAVALAVAAVAAAATGGLALLLFAPFYFMALVCAGIEIILVRRDERRSSRGQLPPQPVQGQAPEPRPTARRGNDWGRTDHLGCWCPVTPPTVTLWAHTV